MAMNAILGKKLGMTQVFDEEGRLVPVSVIKAGPCYVTRTKTAESKDGYCAVQIGFEDIKESRLSRPVFGQFERTQAEIDKARAKTGKVEDSDEKDEKPKDAAKVSPKRYLREIRLSELGDLQYGAEIKVDIFSPGDKVSVTGISKGKGFAGAVKRHHFRGGPAGHGSMIHRKPQSGGATDAARTFKGVRRPGRMGDERVTAQGLRVVRSDPERNLLLIRGSVPGANGGLLIISKQG